MFYPVLTFEVDEFVEEDILIFEPSSGRIRNTEFIVNPFPWFHCQFTFYPDAKTIYGILDMWFYKWFFGINTPDPFKNVIHRMDGPHPEQDGGESYFIDFGTAKPEALLDLIYEVSREGVYRIQIK